jgi:hypothetical protein
MAPLMAPLMYPFFASEMDEMASGISDPNATSVAPTVLPPTPMRCEMRWQSATMTDARPPT